ncbi:MULTISPECIES: hypothetical protein [unclassified Bradyrhizobium]|uniref:hypothetical protein n=1 Tax=unclassified Bradyrhizobium TaxID=2631580 RepID=UPI0028EF45BE|nr:MULTISPECIES: hypothetical protein [unclassified Bradyrhizobium]
MDAFVFKFDAKRLRAIPREYLGFLVASGHCCNELAILLPYIIFEHDLARANDFETAFILTRKLTIDRILISKIFEYEKLCSKFFNRHPGSADPFIVELAKTFEPIASKIKGAKWVAILRNTISFHYDPKHALASVDRLDDSHPLRLMAGRIKGLTLFEFAEEITSRPIFEAAGSGDIEKGMDVAGDFIVELVNMISTFHAHTTISMFERHGMVSDRVQMKLRERYCGAPGSVLIPISISAKFLKALQSRKEAKNRRSKPLASNRGAV